MYVGLPTFLYRRVRGGDSSELGKFKFFAKTNEKEKKQRGETQREKREKHRERQQKNGGKGGFRRQAFAERVYGDIWW